MTDTRAFLDVVLPQQLAADTALHNGDAGPRKELWSHGEPVTVLGAAKTVSGWTEVEQLFDWLAANFSNGVYDIEVARRGRERRPRLPRRARTHDRIRRRRSANCL